MDISTTEGEWNTIDPKQAKRALSGRSKSRSCSLAEIEKMMGMSDVEVTSGEDE